MADTSQKKGGFVISQYFTSYYLLLMKSPQYFSNRTKYLFHILLWLVAFLTPFLLRTSNLSPRPTIELDPFYHGWLYQYACKTIIWVSLFYLNSYVLIPQFIKRNKKWQYFFAQLFLLVAIHYISFNLLKLFIPNYKYSLQNLNNLIYYNTIPFLFVLAGGFILQLYKDRIEEENTFLDEEKKHLLQEIHRMRTKVSPQFVHNALDTLMYLLKHDPGQFEAGLKKLTSLMDYMLLEAESGKTSLTKEIDHLKNYIAFVEQQYRNLVNISIADDIAESDYEVEHLVLLHYVEDAMLKNTQSKNTQQVDVYLYTKNNLLNFIIRNHTITVPVEAHINEKQPANYSAGSIRKLIINTYQKTF